MPAVKQAPLKFATLTFAAAALAAALGAPAMAQGGPTPPFTPQKGPAAVFNDQKYVNDDPIISADLGYGDVGGFTGVIKRATNELCYMISAPKVADATAAKIVAGGKTAVALKAPAGGTTGACVKLDANLAKSLVASPNDYTVQVDSKAYPGGAAVGVLHSWDGFKDVG